MAVTAIPMETALRLVVVVGTSDNGEPITKTRTYSRIKTDADLQAVYDVANVLINLQQHPLGDIQLVVENSLSDI